MPQQEESAQPFLPNRGGLPAMRRAIQGCRGCGLYADATQAVFGEGAARARVMFVGEQPGASEDVEGEPFVGPAGRVLDRAFREAGLRRNDVYLTNIVKHFKFVPDERGKRRIHKKPSTREVSACLPWFAAELRLVQPQLVVCLGATAAKALLGNEFRVSQERGDLLDFPAELAAEPGPQHIICTVHPSSVVRAPDREDAYAGFLHDLQVVADSLSETKAT